MTNRGAPFPESMTELIVLEGRHRHRHQVAVPFSGPGIERRARRGVMVHPGSGDEGPAQTGPNRPSLDVVVLGEGDTGVESEPPQRGRTPRGVLQRKV